MILLNAPCSQFPKFGRMPNKVVFVFLIRLRGHYYSLINPLAFMFINYLYNNVPMTWSNMPQHLT